MVTRLVIILCSFFVGILSADRIHLKNGQIVQGKVTSSGIYWLVETTIGVLKIKKIEVAWVETTEEALPQTPSKATASLPNASATSTKIVKQITPSRKFQEKYLGDRFRAPAPYYYGPTEQSPMNYYSGVSGPNYFFGTLGYSPLYAPTRCYSPYRSGLHFSYRYRNSHWSLWGSNSSHGGQYRSGNFIFRFRSSP